ncbi:MAG: MucBP domain-containing protein [Erysipelothrix sp.]
MKKINKLTKRIAAHLLVLSLIVTSLFASNSLTIVNADNPDLIKNPQFEVTRRTNNDYEMDFWKIYYSSNRIVNGWYTDSNLNQWEEQFKPIPGGFSLRVWMAQNERKTENRSNYLSQVFNDLKLNAMYTLSGTITVVSNNVLKPSKGKIQISDGKGFTKQIVLDIPANTKDLTITDSINFTYTGNPITLSLVSESDGDVMEMTINYTGLSLKQTVAAPTTVKYMDTLGNPLTTQETINGNVGDPYNTQAKDFPNYILTKTPKNASGLLTLDGDEVIYVYDLKDGGDVTVKYIDTENNEIETTEVLKGKITNPYTSIQKDISNYIFKSLNGNKTGVFTNEAQEVTYIYELADGSNVTVKYVDTEGNELADSETLSGKLTKEYASVEKMLDGYVLTETPSNANGVFTTTPQEVIYIYDHAQGADVTVKYVDTEGNELADTETLSGKLTKDYASVEKLIDGYALTETPSNANGVFTTAPQEVVYIYDHANAANVTVKYVDTEGNELADTETLSGKLTKDYASVEKTIDGYVLTETPSNANGVFMTTPQEVIYVYDHAQGADVTVKYVDTEGNVLADSETLSGKLTKDYASVEKTIDGYILTETPSNANGVFTTTPQEVIYVYDHAQGADVTVKYVDTEGNVLADSETLSGKLTKDYASVEKTIDGYILTETPSNANGVFTTTPQEVIYVYDHAQGADVTVKYVDTEGNVLADSETLSGKLTKNYTSVEKTIDGYVLTETPSNANGVFTTTPQEVVYVYDHAQGADVTVKYIDTEGNELADTETLSGKLTKDYASVEKLIDGYALTETPSNANGVFTTAPQEVIYVYDHAQGADVTVKYVDTEGNVLADSETLSGKLTRNYTSVEKTIDGYVLTETPSNANGVFTTTPQEVVYVYDHAQGADVTVKYIDTEGNELADTETLSGKLTKDYASVEKLIDGYALTETPSNANGVFTTAPQEVSYVYDHAQGADVTVKYIDTEGNELADTETLSGKLTRNYTSVEKTIDGYVLTETPSNANGVFMTSTQEVIYIYDIKEEPTVVTPVEPEQVDPRPEAPTEVLPSTGISNLYLYLSTLSIIGGFILVIVSRKNRTIR